VEKVLGLILEVKETAITEKKNVI